MVCVPPGALVVCWAPDPSYTPTVPRASGEILDRTTAVAKLQDVIDLWLSDNPSPRVLDAGCGGMRQFRLSAGAHVVGIDIAADQLENNSAVQERIVGDIQTFPLAPQSFDIVICWDVLEHVPRPRAALQNLRQAVAPGGLLVLAGPNLLSLKGLVTRITPYWFHRAYYRRTHKLEPFRTYLRLATSPDSLGRWAPRHSLSTEYFALYESDMQLELRQRARLRGRLWTVTSNALVTLTGGRFNPSATDFVLVLRPAQEPAPV